MALYHPNKIHKALIQNKNGEKHIFEVKGKLFEEDNKSIKEIVIFNDITVLENERNESAKKDKLMYQQSKMAALDEMIENIAHQWRQPLSQINSAILIIDYNLNKNNIQNSQINDKLNEIESLTKYMSDTINDFKNFLNKHKKMEAFILDDIIIKTILMVDSSLKHNNIKLKFSPNNQQYKISSYPNELQQAILSIINNAQDLLINKNITNPTINIIIKKENDYYSINIYDNAGGIEQSIIDKIFEPYFTTKHKSQGTGLGLYISKMMIEKILHGNISVKNTKEGACFTIKLYERIKDE